MGLFLDQQHWKCVEIQILEAYPMSKNSESEAEYEKVINVQYRLQPGIHDIAKLQSIGIKVYLDHFY